jgi:hypothetical protein
MVDGGDDGLPWRLAGRQWLIESILINLIKKKNPRAFFQVKNTRGATLVLILATSRHCARRALCRDIARIGDFVKY